MYRYTYSYKSDSLREVIGIVNADCIEDAIELISRIKLLQPEDVCELFYIERLKS
jgi:hypothetical protein